MFGRWRGSQEGNDQGDQAYHHTLTALYHHIENVISGVNDVSNNLSSDYPQEALSQLSGYFEGISREFSSYTISTNNMFFMVVRRSNLRTNAAKSVASQAKSVARLFERYSKNPKSYSAVSSRLEIYKLRAVLENLSSHCLG